METRALDRRTEIDVAKGFALFLVVFAHVLDRDSIWAYWIFMFHMPVFFFLICLGNGCWPARRVFLQARLLRCCDDSIARKKEDCNSRRRRVK